MLQRTRVSKFLKIFRAGVLLVAMAILLWMLILPGIPDKIRLYAGPVDGPYYEFGLRLADALLDEHIEVEVLKRAEANFLQQAAESETRSVALLPADLAQEYNREYPGLELLDLGNLGIMPVWLLVRDSDGITSIRELGGKKIYTGAILKYNLAALSRILERLNWPRNYQFVDKDQLSQAPNDALMAGAIDAIVVSGPADSDAIKAHFNQAGIVPLDLPLAEGFAYQNPHTAAYRIPAGALNIENGVPGKPLTTIALSANLITTSKLEPILVNAILTESAKLSATLNTAPGKTGTLPSADQLALPLHPAAELWYHKTESPLVSRIPAPLLKLVKWYGPVVWPVLLIFLLFTIIIPKLLQLLFKIEIRRHYHKLTNIESAIPAHSALAKLDAIDENSRQLYIPPGMESEYMELRQNLHDIRDRQG